MGVEITQEMINGAITTQNKYGVPASVTLAQIKLESGGSNPGGLSGLAYNHNNLFGIKAGSNWTGKTVTLNTQEADSNGNYYTTSAKFRKYNSVAESIEDHGRLLASDLYTNKTKGTTNLNDYVRAMGSIYATSPTYADTLLKIIEQNNFTQYDNGMLPVGGSNTDNVTVTETGLSGALTGVISDGFNSLISKIIKIIVIVLLVFLFLAFFLKAFDVSPSKVVKKAGAKVVKYKTGVDLEPAIDMLEGAEK